MFTASGLLVRFLKVFEKGNYQSVKWVRCEWGFIGCGLRRGLMRVRTDLTKANGTYLIRVSSFRARGRFRG